MFDSPLCPAFSVIYNCCKFYLHSFLLYLVLPSPNGSDYKIHLTWEINLGVRSTDF